MKLPLKNILNQNLIKKIEDYMFYDEKTLLRFTNEWKNKMQPTNCFLFNAFNDSRCNYYKFNEIPCWYCNSKGRRSANSHSVFECIRYHSDLDKFSKKLKKYIK